MKYMQKKQYICLGLILLFLTFFLSTQSSHTIKINLMGDLPISNSQGPEITNVAYTPEEPEWYDNITITAQITDPWGIQEARINYDADNDAYAGWGANFTMKHMQDDLYTYTILNSIWDSPFGPAFGSYVNFTIYAKNGKGIWSQSNTYQFYMNDTIKPVAQILTLTNNSWISKNVQINITVIEEGSGLERMNLSIYMSNGTLLERFTSTNLNETFLWDVSSLPDYDDLEPASNFTMNLTVWDKATPFNKDTIILESIKIDNTPPSIAFINSYKNLTAFTQDNLTITNNIISATDFTNDHTSTNSSDSIYHSFYNDSTGFLQVVYGFNLTNWNVTSEMLNNLSISLEGKIGYVNSSIIAAGWKIWNWIYNNFTYIDSTVYNSTENVSDIFIITASNKSFYINSNFNHRIEIFFFINTTGPRINASIDYIVYNLSYYKIDEWYNYENENITLHIKGVDLIQFDYMVLCHENLTYFQWNTSGEHFYDFNTTALPDGLVPLNLTVYDKAGNSNSSSILLNVDFLGPIITIISPENNSKIGESQIWDIIIPVEISGYDIAENFQKMELWIDGQIGPASSLGQIVEYDEYGNITYEQTNATWYKEGNYTYYWNASTLDHSSQHKLLLCAYDGFENPSEYLVFVTMATFLTNISIIDVRQNYSTSSDVGIILEFSIVNNGNSTLKDFFPQLIIPSNWDWTFKDVDYSDFQYLSPGEILTFKIELIPRSVKNTINQSIDIIIVCQIVENLTQAQNNYTIQFRTYVIIQPESAWQKYRLIFLILISIASGLGIGFISWLVYQYLKNLSKLPHKPIEKPKKEK
ncbi:MAG: hypothetical protein ACFFD2_03705 [Promethearchaeota archaeon]